MKALMALLVIEPVAIVIVLVVLGVPWWVYVLFLGCGTVLPAVVVWLIAALGGIPMPGGGPPTRSGGGRQQVLAELRLRPIQSLQQLHDDRGRRKPPAPGAVCAVSPVRGETDQPAPGPNDRNQPIDRGGHDVRPHRRPPDLRPGVVHDAGPAGARRSRRPDPPAESGCNSESQLRFFFCSAALRRRVWWDNTDARSVGAIEARIARAKDWQNPPLHASRDWSCVHA